MSGRVVIVGGGISGLSAAYYLAKAGIPSTIIESRPRLGGVIQTDRIEGCTLEAGPDSFLAAKPWGLDLIKELGLGDDVISSNDHLRVTYVWKGGKLIPLPDGLMLMIPTRILPMASTGLLSWNTKLRMGMEWFRKASSNGGDRSVAEFVRDHYGQEAVDYLAEPLLSGVYGGDPNKLSVGSVLPRFVELEAKYGSLTKGVLTAMRNAPHRGGRKPPLFQTLKGGLGQLVETVIAATKPASEVIHGTADALEPLGGGGYRIRAAGEWIETAHVVLACQAYEAGALLTGIEPDLAALLNGVPYSNSLVMALGYRKAGFDHPLNGFGFLVPKRERRRLVACTWVGTKFSYRVPDDLAVLRCFLGGESDAALRESDQTLIAAVREEIRDIMGVKAEPLFTRIARWPRSMAQYTVGHKDRVAGIRARLERLPGLYLAGNAYEGIGVPDCIRMGKQAAEKIESRI